MTEGPPVPQDIDAERAVLGAMMVDPRACDEVPEVVRAEDFYRPNHEVIYRAILAVHGAGDTPDVTLVRDRLRKDRTLSKVGGDLYVAGLYADAPVGASATTHARVVADVAVLRRAVEFGTRTVAMAQSGMDADDVVARVAADAETLVTGRVTSTGATIGSLMDDALDAIEHPPVAGYGIKTGFIDLDKMLGPGFLPGHVVIIGARPAVGKTAFGLSIARHASVDDTQPGLFVSLEMDRAALALRMLSAQAGVWHDTMRAGALTEADWTRVAKAQGPIGDAPLVIEDDPHCDLTRLRGYIRRHRPKYVILDYAQLMQTPESGDSRRVDVDALSRGLKLMAKKERVPIVVLCQLNRAVTSRSDRRPAMSDLRESGSWEADADVIMLLHRPALDGDEVRSGEMDVIVAKQRDGATGTVTLAERLHVMQFSDLAVGW